MNTARVATKDIPLTPILAPALVSLSSWKVVNFLAQNALLIRGLLLGPVRAPPALLACTPLLVLQPQQTATVRCCYELRF